MQILFWYIFLKEYISLILHKQYQAQCVLSPSQATHLSLMFGGLKTDERLEFATTFLVVQDFLWKTKSKFSLVSLPQLLKFFHLVSGWFTNFLTFKISFVIPKQVIPDLTVWFFKNLIGCYLDSPRFWEKTVFTWYNCT